LVLTRRVHEGIAIEDAKTGEILATLAVATIDRNKVRIGLTSSRGRDGIRFRRTDVDETATLMPVIKTE